MKKPEEPANQSSLRQAAKAFTKQTDRGSALIAAAWLDDVLEMYLRAFFRSDKKISDRILQPEGPLGSFSARIKLAYLVGIIEPAAYQDLEIIRDLRNVFAHTREHITFANQNVKDKCKRLHAIKALDIGGISIRSPKQMYLISAYFLADYLLTLSETVKQPRILNEDYYGMGIRRFAKSRSIKQMHEALKMLKRH